MVLGSRRKFHKRAFFLVWPAHFCSRDVAEYDTAKVPGTWAATLPQGALGGTLSHGRRLLARWSCRAVLGDLTTNKSVLPDNDPRRTSKFEHLMSFQAARAVGHKPHRRAAEEALRHWKGVSPVCPALPKGGTPCSP